jgi:hypothetical protein
VRDTIEWITGEVLRTIPQGPPEPPGSQNGLPAEAVTLLLRQYAATGRADCRDAAGQWLAYALQIQADSPEWLETFAEAAALSEDDRLRDAIVRGVEAQQSGWPSHGAIDRAARSVEACLTAAPNAGLAAAAAPAIDELERLVGAGYRPGAGIQPREGAPRLIDQVATAAALLTAFGVTARLPYAMLAEELVQFSQRTLVPDSLTASCALVRLLCRVDALHRDADYQQVAIVAPHADYRRDARQLLERVEPECRSAGSAAAVFALAAGEYLNDQI